MRFFTFLEISIPYDFLRSSTAYTTLLFAVHPWDELAWRLGLMDFEVFVFIPQP